jgi:hypothetical protein
MKLVTLLVNTLLFTGVFIVAPTVTWSVARLVLCLLLAAIAIINYYAGLRDAAKYEASHRQGGRNV